MTTTVEPEQDRFAEAAGVRLRWRVVGSGEPLLLIMGYGPPSTLWHLALPYLVDRFACVYYDHRGTGRSDVPEEGYTIEQYARDALTVLDAAGWDSAHVFGSSMGGMIAQQLALEAPERVRTLVLGGTTCGQPAGSRPAGIPGLVEGMKLLVDGDIERGVECILPYLYGEFAGSRPEIAEAARTMIANEPPRRLATPTAETGWCLGWDISPRLGEIRCPTLVVHGHEDRVFPPANAQRLFHGLPNAEIRVYKNAPHAYYALDPARILGQIGDWILTQPTQQGR